MAGVVSYIDQHVQVGQESVIGTAVAANRQLQTLLYTFQDNPTTQQVRPQGQRVDALSFVNTNDMLLTLAGNLDYIESLIALEQWLGAASVTTPSGATNARQRVYDLPLTGAITPKTLTMQLGDSTYVDQFAGAELVTMGCTYMRTAAPALTGSGYAQPKLAGGTTFTASPTTYALQPVEGAHLNFYVDDTGADLGTTQITEEVLSAGWTVSDLRTPFWAADRTQTSYKKSLSSSGVKAELKLTLGYSSAIRTLLDDLMGGATRFLRIENVGALIDSGTPDYYFTHNADIAFQITSLAARKNDNEVYAVDVTADIVGDPTWGHAFQITSITDQATL